MEIRARYVLIGLFTLAVILSGFCFVYWLNNAGAFTQRSVYRIRYEKTVAGLLKGSAVLFNGIRVGEVTSLDLANGNPRQIIVSVAVDGSTPIRADTRAAIEFQGLSGAPVVSLFGGSPTAPVLATSKGNPPLLAAEPDTGISMTESARETLRHIDTVVADNAEPLRKLIANVNTFSEALARNSDRVDGIVAGLERLTGGGAKATPRIFDLSAGETFSTIEKLPAGQLLIPEPTALSIFDSDKLLIRGGKDTRPHFENAQWPDVLPKVLQARLLQSFEVAGYLRAVGRAPEGMIADYQLLIDVRGFHIAPIKGSAADVELSAKIVRNDGRIVAAKSFRATLPVEVEDAPAAAAALNSAFGKVLAELVPWACAAM
jgi:phospholipid/cholesterol/gamma-HCH transport system substrate-binding protein